MADKTGKKEAGKKRLITRGKEGEAGFLVEMGRAASAAFQIPPA